MKRINPTSGLTCWVAICLRSKDTSPEAQFGALRRPVEAWLRSDLHERHGPDGQAVRGVGSVHLPHAASVESLESDPDGHVNGQSRP